MNSDALLCRKKREIIIKGEKKKNAGCVSENIGSVFYSGLSGAHLNHIAVLNTVACICFIRRGDLFSLGATFQILFVTQVLLARFWEVNHPGTSLLCFMDAFQDSQRMNSSILLSLPPAAAPRLGGDEAQVACVPKP